MFGFYKIASAVPKLKIADVSYNTQAIISCIKQADNCNASLIIFPELSITSYTCGDLFFQEALLESAIKALKKIITETKSLNIISAVGIPLRFKNSLYNCAAIVHKGKLVGIIPKSNLPNYREFYEKRWFTPYTDFFHSKVINIFGSEVPFGLNLIFEANDEFKVSFEICEDLWSVIPPSSYHTLAGATIIGNLSASNELIGKAEYRKGLVHNQSAKCICGYIYASAGIHESTADVLYGGHILSAENGAIINDTERFQRDNHIIYSDIDCQKLLSLRLTESCMKDNYETLIRNNPNISYNKIKIDSINLPKNINRKINPLPFVPTNKNEKSIRCTEIFNIQASALAKRLEHTNTQKSIIGISGGLDSTLALLVTLEAHKLIKKSPSDIISITMPGFGTTDRTYKNAVKMCKICNTEIREINIKEICESQFKLLNIDPNIKNTAYENVQARQRTKILMNTANNENGIVIGTGDLSEIALGWSTYNGDHMSMYAVNCGVPKTLIRYLIEWYAEKSEKELKKILIDIINTPVSPELLPPNKEGNIAQKTEDIIGPYELHDFFLYHTIKYGAAPDKITFLAKTAFKEKYPPAYIKKIHQLFLTRFFSQQFKRNCIPDGPKVGTIALSPRGDWRMPPDASPSEWLNKLLT